MRAMNEKKPTKKDTLAKEFVSQILLVEDHRPSALIVKELFENSPHKQYQLTWVQNLEQTLEHLNHQVVDVIILDLGLPDSDGLDTFFDVMEKAPGTPIVIFTAIEDKNLALRAIRQGAQDYLIKNEFQIPLFYRAIQYAIERKRLENELLSKTEHLRVILNSIGDGLIATDEKLKITHLNPVAEYLTGWKEEEAIGKYLYEVFGIVHMNQEDISRNTFERIAAIGKFQSPFKKSLLIDKNEHEQMIDGIIAPIYTHKNQAVGLIIAFQESS